MRHRGITKVIISAISLKKKKNPGLFEINCTVLTAGALRGENIKANSLDELKDATVSSHHRQLLPGVRSAGHLPQERLQHTYTAICRRPAGDSGSTQEESSPESQSHW